MLIMLFAAANTTTVLVLVTKTIFKVTNWLRRFSGGIVFVVDCVGGQNKTERGMIGSSFAPYLLHHPVATPTSVHQPTAIGFE